MQQSKCLKWHSLEREVQSDLIYKMWRFSDPEGLELERVFWVWLRLLILCAALYALNILSSGLTGLIYLQWFSEFAVLYPLV